ncbi:MAG TPA: ankyrin repeat domain-containing protein [Thermoanaerobaculia bacterium]
MSTIDNLKKAAKRWLKALRTNDLHAFERLRRAWPNAPQQPNLRDVQHAIAREQGAESWNALKARLSNKTDRVDPERIETFLESACWDHHVHGKGDHRMYDRAAQRILAENPEIPRDSIYTAIVCGELAEVERILRERPEAARESGGARGWTPILYSSFTRFTHSKTIANAIAIARLLLDHGANPNDFYMAGDSHYTPLTGAAGEGEQDAPRQPYAEALFDLLLERGAEPFDGQVLYDTHFSGDMLWWLKLVYKHTIDTPRGAAWKDPEWMMFDAGPYGSGARFLLETAVKKRNMELAQWVLEHGASPNAPPARDRRFPKRSLYEEALLAGLPEMAELFARYGAKVTQPVLSDTERFVQAAMRLDRDEVGRLMEAHPEFKQSPEVMFEAARRDRPDVIELLIDAGMSVDVADPRNTRALHHAAGANALRAAQFLIDHGAAIDARETSYDSTPIGWAAHGDQTDMIDLLSHYSRNIWTLSFRGYVDRVREIVRENPDLAKQVDNEGITPLWWLPDDEKKAMQIVEVLLANGADPSLRSKSGKTAADWARTRGMLDVAARLAVDPSSGAPVLERYEKLAGDILTAHESGDPEALRRVQEHFGRKLSWQELREAIRRRMTLIAGSDPGTSFIHIGDAHLLLARDAGFNDWSEFESALLGKPPTRRGYTADTKKLRLLRALSPSEWNEATERDIEAVEANGHVNDALLERIASLASVTTLNLEGCRNVTDAGLRHLARMPQLQRLNLTGCAITDAGLRVLRSLPELRSLEIDHHAAITDDGAANLSECLQLERVSLMGTATGDGTIATLAGKSRLHFFQAGDRITDAGLARFHDFPMFKSWQDGETRYSLLSPDASPTFLWLNLEAPFTDAGLARLTRLDGLFALSLFGKDRGGVTPSGFAPLATLPNLGWLGCTGELCDDEAMQRIAAMPRLRMLMCQDTQADDAGFTALSRSSSIEYVWGRRCHKLTRPGFEALSTMPSLRGLAVSCMNLDDAALSALPKFPALRELVPIQIPDDGFRHIGRCENLEALWCMYCQDTGDIATDHIASLRRLRIYYAGRTRITDRSLEILGGIDSLERVELWNCPRITDAGLPFLAKLPNLREVTLQNMPNVTLEAAAIFPSRVHVDYSP